MPSSSRYLETELEDQQKISDLKRLRQKESERQAQMGRSDCELCCSEFCGCDLLAMPLCKNLCRLCRPRRPGQTSTAKRDVGALLSIFVYTLVPLFAVADFLLGLVAKQHGWYTRTVGERLCEWSPTMCAVWIAVGLAASMVALFSVFGKLADVARCRGSSCGKCYHRPRWLEKLLGPCKTCITLQEAEDEPVSVPTITISQPSIEKQSSRDAGQETDSVSASISDQVDSELRSAIPDIIPVTVVDRRDGSSSEGSGSEASVQIHVDPTMCNGIGPEYLDPDAGGSVQGLTYLSMRTKRPPLLRQNSYTAPAELV